MKRWVCPQCERGALAPERPDPEDARRFCFDCSRKTGRLVRRLLPGKESRKESNRARVAEKLRRKAHQRRAKEQARWSIAGVDVREVVRRTWLALAGMRRARATTHLLVGNREPEDPKMSLCYLERNVRLRSVVTWNFVAMSNASNREANYGLRILFRAKNLDAATVWQGVIWALAHARTVVGTAPTERDYLMAAARAANRLWGCRLRPDDASLSDIHRKIRAAVEAREVPKGPTPRPARGRTARRREGGATAWGELFPYRRVAFEVAELTVRVERLERAALAQDDRMNWKGSTRGRS